MLKYFPNLAQFRAWFDYEDLDTFMVSESEIFFKNLLITGSMNITYAGFPFEGVLPVSCGQLSVAS